MTARVTVPDLTALKHIRYINCARQCGYVRPYTDTYAWLTREYVHPAWGLVTAEQAVQNDVYYHDCKTWAEARAKMIERFGEWQGADQQARSSSRKRGGSSVGHTSTGQPGQTSSTAQVLSNTA